MPIRPRISKVIKFLVGNDEGQFATIQDANAAAEAHRAALLAAGDTWATIGDPDATPPGAGPIDAKDGSNSGVVIFINYDATTGAVLPFNVPDPVGSVRVNYHSPEYHDPPA